MAQASQRFLTGYETLFGVHVRSQRLLAQHSLTQITLARAGNKLFWRKSMAHAGASNQQLFASRMTLQASSLCLKIGLMLRFLLMAVYFLAFLEAGAKTYEVRPAIASEEEEFEKLTNSLGPGDELVLRGGTYSQTGRRAVTVKGSAERPIIIRAAESEFPLLTRPGREGQNNIEFIDCEYLVIRGLKFQGGSSGVRFIRGRYVTFEDCEIFETGNNAITMNSGDCDSFVIRRNHIHHTGLTTSRPTEGEGMYIGCHDGSCRTSNSLIEGNYIHHLRGSSSGGNDGIEIKAGSFGNIVRNNVIHDTNIGTKYPGIFVYGGGAAPNIVEGNAIWNCGEGIQVVSDAIIRNNIIFNCEGSGVNAAPHAAMPEVRNTTIVNNTIFNAHVGARLRWSGAENVVFANNAIFCPAPSTTAIDIDPGAARFAKNLIGGRVSGVAMDGVRFIDAGTVESAFLDVKAWNFWPAPNSQLIGGSDPDLAPETDFNGMRRSRTSDVGAYDSGGRARSPGWKFQPGFKR